MKSTRVSRIILRGLLGGAAVCIVAFCLTAFGQVQTSTKSEDGEPTKTVQVDHCTIVYFSGNNVVVKMEDGTLRHFDNVPQTTTVTMDRKQLNVHQLQPGMTVERQTITTATPNAITHMTP